MTICREIKLVRLARAFSACLQRALLLPSALSPRTGDGCWNFGFLRGFWRCGSRMSLGALNYSCSPSFANHSSWYIRFPPKGRFKHAFFLSLFATNHKLIQT